MAEKKYRKLAEDKVSFKLKDRKQFLLDNVIGQDEAIDKILQTTVIAESGLADFSRPAGVFLLLGPTGTGKTHVVEKLAEALHRAPTVFKINCAEYGRDHEVAKLVGAPPGYLGHKETTPILKQINIDGKKSPIFQYTIILLDEIEKSSRQFQEIFLGVFDNGRLTLGDGSTTNFNKTIFFLTSNLGANDINRSLGPGVGLSPVTATDSRGTAGALSSAKKYFSPEFFNRLTDTITFRHLTKESLRKIAFLELCKLELRGANTSAFQFSPPSPAVLDYLVEESYKPEYGAREMKRVIDRLVTYPLAKMITSGELPSHTKVKLSLTTASGVKRLTFSCPSDCLTAAQWRKVAMETPHR